MAMDLSILDPLTIQPKQGLKPPVMRMQGEGGVLLQDDARESQVVGSERRPLLRPGARQGQCDRSSIILDKKITKLSLITFCYKLS